MPSVALTIAGSDPSGGAGIQADLKTFHQLGVYGEAVISLITVQNTLGVQEVEVLTAGLVKNQIRAVIEDIPPAAIKTGALGSAAIIKAVAETLQDFGAPLVVDPVMAGSAGKALLEQSALDALRNLLIPAAFLITPNLGEAAAITGSPPDDVVSIEGMRTSALKLRSMGARNVLITGGHLPGDPIDLLLTEVGDFHEFRSTRIESVHTHGTGCTFSAAITAGLSQKMDLLDAIGMAKRFVYNAIHTAPGLGRGSGPLNHFASTREE